MEHLVSLLKPMKDRIDGLMARLDIPGKDHRIDDIQTLASASDFWNDPEAAQKLMQEMSRLKEQVDRWQNLATRISDALELAQLNDESLQDDLTHEVESLSGIVERMALQALLSGPYDREDAILFIHAGADDPDSQDLAQMLERMYIYWAQGNKYDIEIIERWEGEQAGLQRVTLNIKGEYAYGYLQSEYGIHRLIRLSRFDSADRRHTSFAKVELWRDIQGKIDIEINEKDLKVETSLGVSQLLSKMSPPVRVTHLPTGFTITCKNERSEWHNRERALHIIKARLLELEYRNEKADFVIPENDNTFIRSYILHPYQLVQDHRTRYETDNPLAVLDGRISEIMIGYLRLKFENMNARIDGVA